MSISISKRNEGSVTFRDAAGCQPIENLISSRLGAVLEAAGRPYAPKLEDVCSRLHVFPRAPGAGRRPPCGARAPPKDNRPSVDVVQVLLTLNTADLWVAGLTTPAAHHRPPPYIWESHNGHWQTHVDVRGTDSATGEDGAWNRSVCF